MVWTKSPDGARLRIFLPVPESRDLSLRCTSLFSDCARIRVFAPGALWLATASKKTESVSVRRMSEQLHGGLDSANRLRVRGGHKGSSSPPIHRPQRADPATSVSSLRPAHNSQKRRAQWQHLNGVPMRASAEGDVPQMCSGNGTGSAPGGRVRPQGLRGRARFDGLD